MGNFILFRNAFNWCLRNNKNIKKKQENTRKCLNINGYVTYPSQS